MKLLKNGRIHSHFRSLDAADALRVDRSEMPAMRSIHGSQSAAALAIANRAESRGEYVMIGARGPVVHHVVLAARYVLLAK